MTKIQDQRELNKIKIQAKCFAAIRNLQEQLAQIKTDIQNNRGIGITWQVENDRENSLYEVLKEYQTVVRPFETVKDRLEYLRGEIEAERISYSEIAELQNLKDYIEDDDVLLKEWAGIPEFEEE
jgi:hypothetical protein